jgi:hypothetical protein
MKHEWGQTITLGVWTHKALGPDEYLGRVHDDGKLYHHKQLAPDDYLGKVDEMISNDYGGAAFLLLVLPAVEEEADQAASDQAEDNEPTE